MDCCRNEIDPATGEAYVSVCCKGQTLTSNPTVNKGSAFTAEERDALDLRGMFPAAVDGIEQQLLRCREHYDAKGTDLERYIYLSALQDQNETLFYRFLLENIEEMLPIVYTPVVGEACQKYSHIYRRPRGVYITPNDVGHIERILAGVSADDVRVIVVTDNERILGLGDQGAGGMGIPIGKLSIYTTAAGIHPYKCLPVSLDVGTDNSALLGDPLYLGHRQPRLRGAAYDALIEEFVIAVQKRWPNVLLQWEDFANTNAFRLLEKYKDRICSFNDDIQGTGAVALAGMITAVRARGARMSDQTVVFFGAGEAASGTAAQVVELMKREGTDEATARRKLWFVDSKGLVMKGGRPLPEHKEPYARTANELSEWKVVDRDRITLEETVRHVRPSVLVGTSGTPSTFTESVLRTMAANCKQPIIMPLSNPTSKAECAPMQAIQWTDGRCLVATGSPFAPVVHGGKTFRTGQANNAFIFPGVGLAIVAAGARRVTDGMFRAAAVALADAADPADLAEHSLYPSISKIRQVARTVAVAVVVEAIESGVAKGDPANAKAIVDAAIWYPEYLPYRFENR